MTNIAASLVEMAARSPDAPAIIEPRGTARLQIVERRWTFARLDAESDQLARGLQRMGLRRGMRTVLMVPPSLEFYALTFALFKLGAVVVLIDPGMGIANLGICLGEAEPAAFVGIAKAHLARVLFRWAKKTIRLRVTVGRRWFWGGWTLDRVRREGTGGGPVLEPTAADETAAILFTSGSTGVAKGVVYTHAVFASQAASLRALYHIEPGEIDLPTFPLFGLFGPALGMTAVIPEMDFTRPARVDPRCILNAVRHYGVTNLFGSPALLRRVGSSREAEGVKLPTLRRVLSAGAPVRQDVIRGFVRLLSPGIQVHTPYGATEALPVTSIGSEELLGETARLTDEGKGVCVGRPASGMTVKIIRITDEPISTWSNELEVPAGQIGEIVVQGPVVTRTYHNRPESTALAKIPVLPSPLTPGSASASPGCATPTPGCAPPTPGSEDSTRGFTEDHPQGVQDRRAAPPEPRQGWSAVKPRVESSQPGDAASQPGVGGWGFEGHFWHRMGDVGYLDDKGRLWFCGRKSQRVATPQGTLFTIPCEAVFNTHPQVFRTALVGVIHNNVTEPVLCVELSTARRASSKELRAELLALGQKYPHTANIRHILFHPGFPVDVRHNAKIFREKLAVWAAAELARQEPPA